MIFHVSRLLFSFVYTSYRILTSYSFTDTIVIFVFDSHIDNFIFPFYYFSFHRYYCYFHDFYRLLTFFTFHRYDNHIIPFTAIFVIFLLQSYSQPFPMHLFCHPSYFTDIIVRVHSYYCHFSQLLLSYFVFPSCCCHFHVSQLLSFLHR